MFEINDDGSCERSVRLPSARLAGAWLKPDRQNEPHAHSVTVWHRANNQLIVCDLGLDKVLRLRY